MALSPTALPYMRTERLQNCHSAACNAHVAGPIVPTARNACTATLVSSSLQCAHCKAGCPPYTVR